MKSIVIIATLAVLTGCAAVVDPMTTPDGKRGFAISCDGSAESWSKCYNAAIQSCGGAYDVVDKNQSSTPSAYGPIVTRNLIISCKK